MVKGIVRRIDELGRIVIPKEYRDTYGVQAGAPLGMFLQGNVISLIMPGDKFIGIVRNLDELGRYTLPIETRRVLGIETGQKMDIFIDRQNDAISIQKFNETCVICGSEHDLIEVDGKYQCIPCLHRFMRVAQKRDLL